LQWEFPINPSSLTRFRKRLGSERLQKLWIVDIKDTASNLIHFEITPKSSSLAKESLAKEKGLQNQSKSNSNTDRQLTNDWPYEAGREARTEAKTL
jgi:hypothetical protein